LKQQQQQQPLRSIEKGENTKTTAADSNKPNKIILMTRLIIACFAIAALVSLSACSTEPTTQKTTTTSQESITGQSPISTTTTETQSK
jgi:hypothetical protein